MDLLKELKSLPGLIKDLSCLKQDPFPDTPVLFAKIKLLWQCNLSCKFCGRNRSDHIMPFEIICDILNNLLKKGLKKIHFSGGEVLLHPDILRILKYSVSSGIQVNLTTNGTLITKETARMLADMKVHAVSVSLDGSTSRLHDKLRNKKGAHRATVKGIEHLIRYRKKYPRIRINTVVLRDNADDLDALHQLLKKLSYDLIWKLIPVDSPEKQFHLTKDQVVRLFAKIGTWELVQEMPWKLKDSMIKKVVKGLYAGGYYQTHPCYIPWLHLFIDPSGFVYPCCMMRSQIPALGRFPDQSLDEILTGPGMKNIRLALGRMGRPFEICHQCDDFILENKHIEKLIQKPAGA